MERTLVLLKPDAVQRRLVGKLIDRFEAKGLRIAGMKLMQITRELAERHYAPHKGKPFYEPLLAFITRGPSVAMVLEGPAAIEIARRMLGATFGTEAAPGTIRGDFGVSNRYNLVHGSDSAESADTEIGLFFTDAELPDYRLIDGPWVSEKIAPPATE